jgi:hypothetical protein
MGVGRRRDGDGLDVGIRRTWSKFLMQGTPGVRFSNSSMRL